MKKTQLARILRDRGQKYSEALGIAVSDGKTEIFKWFVASLLFEVPISEKTAIKDVQMLREAWSANAGKDAEDWMERSGQHS